MTAPTGLATESVETLAEALEQAVADLNDRGVISDGYGWKEIADALLASGAVRPATEVRAEVLRKLADDIDVTGYGWTDVLHAQRFVDRLRARAALAEEAGRG